MHGQQNIKIGYVFWENMVLKKIFWAKSDDIRGEWRKLHNEKLCDLYCSTNIIQLIKPSSMRWAGNISCPHENSTDSLSRNAGKILPLLAA